MFWHCAKMVRYWTGVLARITSVFTVHIDATPLTCILGHVEDLATGDEGKLAIARVLYMARKRIAQHWLDSCPPTIKEFEVNWLISLEKGIYLKRGTISKFEKIWFSWLDTLGLAPIQLTRDRALVPPLLRGVLQCYKT